MEFRWVAIITLWTMLVAPIFDAPFTSKARSVKTTAASPACLAK